MDAQYWLNCWQQGEIGVFHQDRVTPLLAKYWPALGAPAGCRVLVPLCGKTLDMVWLAGQGYAVLGVELSPLAVEQFFAENGLSPSVSSSPMGKHYRTGAIEILCADIFDLDAQTLGSCAAAYDRAALVALPAEMRARYVEHVYGQLMPQYRGLLLTLDYDTLKMQGPPFSVDEVQAQALYHPHSRATLIDRRDILDKDPRAAAFGLTRFDTLVFRLEGA